MRRLLIAIFAPGLAIAAEYPELPPTVQVLKALREYPAVRAAAAGIPLEEANSDRLAAGPHELSVRIGSQQRHDRSSTVRFREHEIGIERTIRLPGKAEKDIALGLAGIEQARLTLSQARNESARLLLGLWFSWKREVALAENWKAQVDTMRRLHDTVGRRVAAGDAARVERLLAGAQLAQAEANLAQAQGRVERVAIEFVHSFPAISMRQDAGSVFVEPPASADSIESWRERLLTYNSELAVARGASRRSQIAAQRSDAERTPDPSFGVRFGSERDGQERIVGVQMSIPFSGPARAAGERAARAEVAVAAAQEAQAMARAESEALRTINMARNSLAHWRRLADVASRMEENASLIEKAWRLGEGQFVELQAARRQAIDAQLAATQARIDAVEAHYRMRLDAADLWELNGGTLR